MNLTETIQYNGSSQRERLLNALLPSYFQLDERSSSDLLSFMASLAENVHFFNLDNSIDGNWSSILNNDLSIFLAIIVSTDLNHIETKHNTFLNDFENAARKEDKIEALLGIYTQILELSNTINDWYTHALHINKLKPGETNELENELENAIKQQLSKNLAELFVLGASLDFYPSGKYNRDVFYDHLHSIWRKRKALSYPEPISTSYLEGFNDEMKKLRILFRTYYSVLSYLVQRAPQFYQHSLEEKDDHKPDMAMLIAFVHLFKHNQLQLNGITEKHLDFYYDQVLQMKERNSVSDQIHVNFQLSPHVESFKLDKGTLLSAGVDSKGNSVQYQTDEDLWVSQSVLSDIKTLFISKNPKIGIGSSYKLITNLYAAPYANSADGLGKSLQNGLQSWPLFGEELLEKPVSDRQMVNAEIGWAISSPILEMEEGHRIVKINMQFEKKSMHTLNLLIKDISKNQELSREDTFAKIFRNSLKVLFSSNDQWIEGAQTDLMASKNEDELILLVSLPNTAAPLTKPDDILGYKEDSPVMKILHNSQDVIFTYSFLKELVLKKIQMDVEVQGIRKMQLSNEFGAIESSIPFQPFGAIPQLGSYLLIGKSELFKKELTDLEIQIDWHNLPENKKGLKGYFKEYGLALQNESFKVKFSALSESKFYPESSEAEEFSLFQPDETDKQQISSKTCFTRFPLKSFQMKPNLHLEANQPYTIDTQAGFFKMELSNPHFCFGHQDYTQAYTKVITHNTDPKRRGEELPFPNQPWTPVARSISVNYKASAQINILSVGTLQSVNQPHENLYHVHPFGKQLVFQAGKPISRHLLPAYDEDAYLYLGFEKAVAGTVLSLSIQLKENQDYFSGSSNTQLNPINELIWSYLEQDEWKIFSQSQILSDSTNLLLNSGILQVELPKQIDINHSILPAGKFWMRATLRGQAQRMPRVLHFATQSVSATWVDNGNGDEHLLQALQAGTIQGLASGIPQIRQVEQPFPSFGGRAAETRKEFYVRVSERLRHKNRAVSSWDFERLVLEKFPQIFQVKCITRLGYEQFVEKGKVIIVVLPRAVDQLLPVVNNYMLKEIKDYLLTVASPFIDIEVRNPIYERIKISAAVQFQEGKNNGNYLKKLNQDIMTFLCPWLFGIEKELELGGQISKDLILSFIEKLDYVSFVTKFSAVQVFPTQEGFDVGDTAIDTSSSPLLKATTPWSVLIPFQTNPIYLQEEYSFQSPEKAGIDTMMLDGDFVMTVEKDVEL